MVSGIKIPWGAGSGDTDCREWFFVPSPDADQKENDSDEDNSAGDRNDNVEPQVEIGAPWYAADFLGIPERKEKNFVH
jgi:hypothetical protein